MPDFKKTRELFEQQGYTEFWNKRPKQLELLDDELWEAKVINPDTNTYRQTADLPIEYRKFGEGKKYPTREVLQIIRIKRLDSTEWLKSRGKIVGLDKAGNEVEHSWMDPELFYKPITHHEFKRKDPKNEYSPMERVCVEANINPYDYRYTEYTLPFNLKNFENLYKQRPTATPYSVSLVIYVEGASEKPRQITSIEKFSKTPFDDLWQEAITPKYKLDRNYSDSLEASHIG